jgi:hypothetical protein
MDYFNTNGYKLEEDYYRDHPDELGTPTGTFKDAFEETLDDYYKRTSAADTTEMKMPYDYISYEYQHEKIKKTA